MPLFESVMEEFVTGIASVWFSRKENILVYPVGVIYTVIYVYLSFKCRRLDKKNGPRQ